MWNNNTVEDEIQRNSLEYGVSVNTDRSIPDAKSGLKPVARRIVYDAFIEGRTSNKPHVKSARIVGDTMGRFHPHGDSSIYGAMIRLSQDWVMRYPLIDVHGNNGTILGDGPAASRYTEARLAKITEAGMLQGLKKKNVDFVPNYDESENEPVTLPAIFPNLLCNPNEGIGWAMGCSWAPHNLREVRDAIFAYLDGNEPMLPGPDFPTGGVIINKDDVPSIMQTGHGSVKIRGKYKVSGQNVIFYEIPYGTRVESLMEEIGAACDEGKITGIADIRNETGKKGGIKLAIQLERGTTVEDVVTQLFAKTNLQTSFSYNQVALIGKTPTELNLKSAIEVYVNHNIECIVREAEFDLAKVSERIEIINGLLKALEDIDNIIKLIKKSANAATAKEALIDKYGFSDIQAQAILDMKLAKLANLGKIELENEKAELTDTYNKLTSLLANKNEQIDELRDRLNSLVRQFGDARRTELIQISSNKKDEDIASVVPEDVTISIYANGNIKKTSNSIIKVQRRNTKGIKTESDAIINTISTNTIDTVMLFTNKCKMHKLLVNKIPTCDTPANTLVKLEAGEKVVAAASINREINPEYVFFFTKQGMVKKTTFEEYTATKKSGIIALKLRDGDELANVIFGNDEDLVVVTKNGYSIRFNSLNVIPIGRASAGVKSIALTEDDEVVKGCLYEDNKYIATFTQNGMAKKTIVEEFPCQMRGGKGIKCHNLTGDDTIVGVEVVSMSDYILLAGSPSTICISSKDIPVLERVTMGNVMTKSKVRSVCKVKES